MTVRDEIDKRKEKEDIETRVALIERDISQLAPLSDKLSEGIDKLTEIASTLKQIGAIHEVKLQQHDALNAEQNAMLKELKDGQEDIKQRLVKLENWRWYTIGISTAMLYVLESVLSIFHLGIGPGHTN